MLKKGTTFLLLVVAAILIIYGLSEFSLSSMATIASLAIGIGMLGVLVLSRYMSE